MTLEQIAIILEGISFFAVTLDLFGKKRLERFQSAIESRLTGIKNVDFGDKLGRLFSPSTDEDTSDLTYGILLFIAVPISIVLCTVFMWRGFGWWLWQPVLLGVVIGIVCAYFSGVVTFIIIIVIEFLLDLILGFGVWILKQARLEGVLLATGTVLFLISKTLSYINAA